MTAAREPDDRDYRAASSYWAGQRIKKQFANKPGLASLAPEKFESWWRRALHEGVVEHTDFEPSKVSLQPDWPRPLVPNKPEGLEIVFRPDPAVFDGRFANNGWLQELPKPLTKLTWDNAALISPGLAEARGLDSGDVIELRYDGRTVEAPVWVLPGHPDGSVTVHLGYGRTRAGKVGTGVGFNAYALRTWAAPDFHDGLEIRKTGAAHKLASTQTMFGMEGRHHLRSGTLDDYHRDRHFAQKIEPAPRRSLTLYDERQYDGYKWGMVIDLNACTGCNACAVACQAENNVPVVGKEQVLAGRHMHWLRVDTYYKGDLDNPETYFQPVPCMHCENAPCELVCPVAATVHSSEGLNDMVYNRCVGTRYCSNNCPYKVRRFNFLAYTDFAESSLSLLRNPEVTVRSRGVMEKCTYCVQRISRARIEAEKENRLIRDGEVQTACQAACPAGAIVFGDLNDCVDEDGDRDIDGKAHSRVAKLHDEPRNYAMLADLNTRPRTTYLAALRNPHSPDGKAP
jgi:molybdopterin-containing oxidoreductase family iron-sulfur binding subunit